MSAPGLPPVQVLREESLAENDAVVKQVLREGESISRLSSDARTVPVDGCEISVHFTGYKLDGTVFDSTRQVVVAPSGTNDDADEEAREEEEEVAPSQRIAPLPTVVGRPFKFRLGRNQVIRGWDRAVATMHRGELARVVCKPEYAYGSDGSYDADGARRIGPNETLVYDIEVLSWHNRQKVTEDNQVMKEIIRKAPGPNRPNDNATVTVRYQGRYVREDGEEVVFDSAFAEEPRTFVLGEVPEMPRGLEKSVENLYKNELSLFYVHPRYGYGEEGEPELGVPPNAHLRYEIELVDFVKGPESWNMTFEERCAAVEHRKELGNELYRRGKYEEAFDRYYYGFKMFKEPQMELFTEEQRQRVFQLRVVCHNNAAACKLKLGAEDEALVHCNYAVEYDADNFKARFRRAKLLTNVGELEDALADLEVAVRLEPENAVVARMYKDVKGRISKSKRKQRRAFQDLFSKVDISTQDDEEVAKDYRRRLDVFNELVKESGVDETIDSEEMLQLIDQVASGETTIHFTPERDLPDQDSGGDNDASSPAAS